MTWAAAGAAAWPSGGGGWELFSIEMRTDVKSQHLSLGLWLSL